ncbi:MAG: macro domain-containing protein [Desulfovibrio sp.]
MTKKIFLTTLKTAVSHYPSYFLKTFGLLWGFIEPIIALASTTLATESIKLTYGQLFVFSIFISLVWLMIDGILVTGFLKQSISIKSNGFDTNIIIEFGNLFKQEGWKAIPVNDFFDSIVDGKHISKKTLHGLMLTTHWGGHIEDWNTQVESDLVNNSEFGHEQRASGKCKRYAIGTTCSTSKDEHKFLCVALTHTDVSNLETKATPSDLYQAVIGLLKKARSICGNEPLSIPLMGSGLSRVGIKSNPLINLIVTAIIEETKVNKVTNEIRIILPEARLSEISLTAIQKIWS